MRDCVVQTRAGSSGTTTGVGNSVRRVSKLINFYQGNLCQVGDSMSSALWAYIFF